MANPLKMLKLKPTSFQFIQEIPIDASPAKTWKSLLNMRGWWHFDGQSMKPDGPIKPKAGALITMSGPDGTEMVQSMVMHVEPGKLLGLGGPMGMTHVPVQNVFIFELQPKGKGTLLRLGQRTFGFIDPDMKKRFGQGWGMLMKNLKALAEK